MCCNRCTCHAYYMQVMLDGHLLVEKVEWHVGHFQQRCHGMYTVGTSDAQAVADM